MYFDAVLDDLMRPLFNGTPEETRRWLEENLSEYALNHDKWVCVGRTMNTIRVSDYLARK